jgi:hypothetical protein
MYDPTDKNEFSKQLTACIVAFDRHCLVYFFLIGFVLGAVGPTKNPLAGAGIILFLGGFFWYVAKSLLTCGDTIATMRANGEPLFKCGDVLTEYDETRARRTGQAAGEAIAREIRRHDREKQERLDNR